MRRNRDEQKYREQAVIGKAEQVGMCREQAQAAERRQKTDGQGWVRSRQQWSGSTHEL